MYGKYPAISIHEEKIHIHRLLFMYWNKSDIPKNYSIHHIDENKLNASKENLIMVQSSFHNSAHNTGKVPSENVRNAIIKLNHSRKGKRGTLHRPDVSYSKIIELKSTGYSVNKIAKTLNCDWTTIKAHNPWLNVFHWC